MSTHDSGFLIREGPRAGASAETIVASNCTDSWSDRKFVVARRIGTQRGWVAYAASSDAAVLKSVADFVVVSSQGCAEACAPQLRSVGGAGPRPMAVGDCARFTPRPLPRIGVHGVRQAPVLLAALEARGRGEDADQHVYRPREHFLSVLDLGAGHALATRARWWWGGRGALMLKRRIDRRWIESYRAAGG